MGPEEHALRRDGERVFGKVKRMIQRGLWGVLGLCVLLGLWRLKLDVDILNLLPPEEPTVQGLKLYQNHFTNARELLISLRAKDEQTAERLAKSLAEVLRQRTNDVATANWQPPWMDAPQKLGELLAFVWLNQPPAAFAELAHQLAPENAPSVLQRTKELLATSMSPMEIGRFALDPFGLLNVPALTNLSGLSMEQGQQMFASDGAVFRVVYVYSAVDLSGYKECDAWLRNIRGAVERLQAESPQDWGGVRVRFTGRPVFVQEIASAMQRDISGSVVGTSLIIALLFWATHRRLLPMLWLLTLLALVLIGTVGLGSLLLGSISVVSMGFAAVLLGLAVDYAVVHYQEALAHPNLSIPEIRRAIAPSILWAAITTISAFLVLNLGGVPGLGQLGSLVALGVGLAALVMVMIYLPPLFPNRRIAPPNVPKPAFWQYFLPPKAPAVNQELASSANATGWMSFGLTAGLLIVCAVVLVFRMPGIDKSGNALRPQNSEAEQALAEITSEMGIPPDPLWVVLSGKDESEVHKRLTHAEELLGKAVTNHVIGSYMLPTVMWPRLEHQEANKAVASKLAGYSQALLEAAATEGFTSNATVLAQEVLETWRAAGGTKGAYWPSNDVSQWLLKRFTARSKDQMLAIGLVNASTNNVDESALRVLTAELADGGSMLSGWSLLGSSTVRRVQERQWLLVLPMLLLVLASLWFAFGRWLEIALGAAVMLLSGCVLLAVMGITGWSWNLLNLMSFPLILGTGVDYSIFMQMGLRRHNGDIELVRRSIGRALLLCGGTAVAGFGSLAWSSNPGMASLGKVCAVGIGCNMLIAVFLLPGWWVTLAARGRGSNPQAQT